MFIKRVSSLKKEISKFPLSISLITNQIIHTTFFLLKRKKEKEMKKLYITVRHKSVINR